MSSTVPPSSPSRAFKSFAAAQSQSRHPVWNCRPLQIPYALLPAPQGLELLHQALCRCLGVGKLLALTAQQHGHVRIVPARMHLPGVHALEIQRDLLLASTILTRLQRSALAQICMHGSRSDQHMAGKPQGLTSIGSASMSVRSANLGSPCPRLARMPLSATGCLYLMPMSSSWLLHMRGETVSSLCSSSFHTQTGRACFAHLTYALVLGRSYMSSGMVCRCLRMCQHVVSTHVAIGCISGSHGGRRQ